MSNTATETALLITMYSATMPRTCILAAQGHLEALRSLELKALADELEQQVIAACLTLRDRGVTWGAIHNTAHQCARNAKSVRGQIILRSMARIALAACPVEARTR